jgi:signal transduction histidine kinase/DNA-binding response OmpR family regulator
MRILYTLKRWFWQTFHFVLCVLLLFGFVLMMLVAAHKYQESETELSHSYSILATVTRVSALFRDAALEHRGFVFTEHETFELSFNETLELLDEEILKLETLTVSYPLEAEMVSEMRAVISDRVEELQGEVAKLKNLNTKDDRQLKNAYRSSLDVNLKHKAIDPIELRLVSSVEQLLVERLKSYQTTTRASFLIGLGLLVSAVFMAGSGAVVIRRMMRAIDDESRMANERADALEADRQKSEFLANMSHEIRTPMNSVLGFAELLRNRVTDDLSKKYVAAIETGGKALLELINDILDISKVEAGHLVLNLQPTSLRELMQSIELLFSEECKGRSLELKFEVSEDVPECLMLDPTRMRQVLLNLVGNAVKFTEDGQVGVRVSTKAVYGEDALVSLYIEVFDTGRGIASGDLERIFKPFEQVGELSDRNPQHGTGLGLSITKRLVEFHHGSIRVESELGVGSTFFVEFREVPMGSPDLKEIGLAESRDSLNQFSPMEVLIVDDVPLNRELLIGFFRETHHRVMTATDGVEALEKVEEMNPDVVLLDIRMPRMDGREVQRYLSENPSTAKIPVIAVTASSMVAEERELREIFDGYVRKPFSRAELVRALDKVRPKLESEPTLKESDDLSSESLAGINSLVVENVAQPSSTLGEGDLKVLVGHLTEARSQWEQISLTMAHSQVVAFARKIEKLGTDFGCKPVVDWAVNLRNVATQFEISKMESQMKLYMELVTELEERINNSNES